MKFDGIEDYIRAAGTDSSLALIPIPMAAELFGITGSGIAARVKNGALRGVKVGSSKYILLESVLSTLRKSDEDISKVKDFLEEQARNGVSSVEYGPVMGLLGLSSTLSADRTKIGWILGAVSRRTFNEGKGLLSVIVHRKGTGMPSENGFFSLVESLAADGVIDPWQKKYKSHEDFVAAETRRVLRSYRK